MGNSLSQTDIETRQKYIDKITSLKVPVMDIGNKNGTTGYLDFIRPDELGSNNIMKGYDSVSRLFIVFKAEFEYPNGLKKKTFTTFFQRYSDNILSWQCCGHYGTILMYTEGGTNNEQYKLLCELFLSGIYKINKDTIYEQKLNFRFNDGDFTDELTDDDYPINIKLGHSV